MLPILDDSFRSSDPKRSFNSSLSERIASALFQREHGNSLTSSIIQSSVFILFYIHPKVTTVILRMLQCTNVNGSQLLIADMDV